jgi:hypothetical protein
LSYSINRSIFSFCLESHAYAGMLVDKREKKGYIQVIS